MKTLTIAGLELKDRYIQGPLAGYTTWAMRKMAYEYGAGLAYTEMTSCNALFYHNKKTEDMLPKEKEDGPLALQLFGSDDESVLYGVKVASEDPHYDFLDFNLGCPAKKVLKQKAGSALLDYPEFVYYLIRKMVAASSRPVIVKMRLGVKENHGVELAKGLEAAGVKAIAVHGRTTKEGFTGPVHYDVIGEIKKAVSVPVIANGNITVENFAEVEKITGADGFMIARDAIGYPKIFEDFRRLEEGKPIRGRTYEEQKRCFLEHLDLLIREKGEKEGCTLIRGMACAYFKGLDVPNIRLLRTSLVSCSSRDDYLRALGNFETGRKE